MTPEKPGDKSYAEVLTDLKFYGCSRKPGEYILTFMVELCAVAEHCNFGLSLDAMIRDRMVCGINNDKTLLTKGDKLMLAVGDN